VRDVRARDPAALEPWLERLRAIPRYLAAIDRRRGRLLSEHDLDDLAQDAALRIWRKLEVFEPRATLENWIYRFCLLEYMNQLRKRSRAPRHIAPGDDLSLPELEEPPALDELAHGLDQLPESEAYVVELRHFDELSFQAIGERLGISDNTAKTRYYRALSRLRAKLCSAVPEEWR
jgi:RNA polymerase sigma-70 factor (ECF subfamily)